MVRLYTCKRNLLVFCEIKHKCVTSQVTFPTRYCHVANSNTYISVITTELFVLHFLFFLTFDRLINDSKTLGSIKMNLRM